MTKTLMKTAKELEVLKDLRVLVSVSNRDGIIDLINQLKGLLPLEVVATPGTARYLSKAGIQVIRIEDITGVPELFNGRIKMIHLPIFAAILADQHNPTHMKQLQKLGIKPFHMVVVNLYPFKEKVQGGAVLEEVIENIDVGGPAALRAAAKNFQSIITVSRPEDYTRVVEMLQEQGNLSFGRRKKLAQKAFELTLRHDQSIIDFLLKKDNFF